MSTLSSAMPSDAARPASRPVDLVHLARQTLGNRDLEREVLQLFLRQSETYLARFGEPNARTAEIAHVLLGSARGIGAHGVARAAEAVERAALEDPEAPASELDRLRGEVAATNAFIRSLVAA